MDRHFFDADPDPDWPMRILPQVLHILENREHEIYFLQSNTRYQFTIFFLSRQWQRPQDFKYFGQHTEISRKKQKINALGIETDPGRPDPGRHSLNADTDTDPAK